MLPFLGKNNRNDSSVAVIEAPEGSQDLYKQGLCTAAEEMLEAINNKDQERLIGSIRAMFEILQMEPHNEANEE